MNILTTIIAQAQPGAPATGPGGILNSPLIFFVLIFMIFYFMIIRPQQRKEKERKAMIDNLKSGTRIVFGGGIMGTVTNVKEDVFVVKIADNVKVEVLRDAVSRVLEKGEKAGEGDGSK